MAASSVPLLRRPRKAVAVIFWFVTTLLLACLALHWQVQRRVSALVENLEDVQSQNSRLQQQLAELRRLKQAADNAKAHEVLQRSGGVVPGMSPTFARRLSLWHVGTQSKSGCLPINANGTQTPLVAEMNGSKVVDNDGFGRDVSTVTGTNARLPACFIVSGHSASMMLKVRHCSASKNLDGTYMTNAVAEYLFLNAGDAFLVPTDGTRSYLLDPKKAVFAKCSKNVATADNQLYFWDDIEATTSTAP